LRVRLGALETELEASHPGWIVRSDARLTCFAKLANTVESAELALKFLDECLAKGSWWAANYNPMPTSADTSIYIQEFSQFAKTGMLQLAFGAVESSFRVFLRAIDPEACEGSTREFKSVYECLLRTKLGLPDVDDRIALLDLLRILRNSIHNHGVFFHRTKADTTVTYRGQRYDFAHESRIEFAPWPFLVTLIGDAAELLSVVAHSPEISGYASPLLDPAVRVERRVLQEP